MGKPDLLDEQIAYYRARAAEYDEWFYRHGRYDRGEHLNQLWFTEAEQVRQALLGLPTQNQALELACGTGIWTQELVRLAGKVTALDASPEMIQINRTKVQSDKVEYIQTDLFQWQPTQQVDMVFFGFWLSHVPPDKLDSFLRMVASALKPGGHIFMVDSRRQSTSTAANQAHPGDGVYQERQLNDGRSYTIVKIYYESEPLQAAFTNAGFEVTVNTTGTYFIYAQGRKA